MIKNSILKYLCLQLQSCLNQPNKLNVYEDLIDGTLLYEVLLLM